MRLPVILCVAVSLVACERAVRQTARDRLPPTLAPAAAIDRAAAVLGQDGYRLTIVERSSGIVQATREPDAPVICNLFLGASRFRDAAHLVVSPDGSISLDLRRDQAVNDQPFYPIATKFLIGAAEADQRRLLDAIVRGTPLGPRADPCGIPDETPAR